MMKCEFEKLANCWVPSTDYELIEAVYMAYDFLFPAKEDIVYYYHCHGMKGIYSLYNEHLKTERKLNDLKNYMLGIAQSAESEYKHYYTGDYVEDSPCFAFAAIAETIKKRCKS